MPETDDPSDNNIVKLIRCFVEIIQEREDLYQAMLVAFLVDSAIGVQLDMIGKLVGQGRNGMVDDDYRRYIKARITVNKSDGLIEELITIAKLVVNDEDAYFHLINMGSAELLFRVEDITMSWSIAEILMEMLTKAVGGGIRLVFTFSPEPVGTRFRFAPYSGPDTGNGWGSTITPGLGAPLASSLSNG